MPSSEANLKDYYISRLSEYIQTVQELLETIKEHQRMHQESHKILVNLSHLQDFPVLAQLAQNILQTYTPERLPTLKTLIKTFSEHPKLKDQQSSKVLLTPLSNLKKLWDQNTYTEDPVVKLKRLAHSLRGSGGTFGFQDISESATLVDEGTTEELIPGIEHLLQVLNKHAPQSPSLSQAHKILIIQKDQALSFILQHSLEENNYHVVLSETASEAWQTLEHSSFDLIISDLVLPDIDGRHFVNELRARTDTQHTPIVLLASAMAMQALSPKELPVNQIIEKPFQTQFVLQNVQNLLKKHTSQAITTPFYQESDPSILPELNSLQAHLKKLSLGEHYLLRLNFLNAQQKAPSPQIFNAFVHDLKQNLHPSYTPALIETGKVALLIPDTSRQKIVAYIRILSLRYQKNAVFAPFQFQIACAETNSHDLNKQLQDIEQLFLAPETEPSIFMSPLSQEKKTLILLADDDPLIASIICFRLKQAGYEVQHLTAGDKVLLALEKNLPSLLILDVKMPGLDGFSVLKLLRQKYSSQDLPIVMLTSLGNEEHIVEGFRLGANEYLTKPFSPDELLSRIQRFI